MIIDIVVPLYPPPFCSDDVSTAPAGSSNGFDHSTSGSAIGRDAMQPMAEYVSQDLLPLLFLPPPSTAGTDDGHSQAPPLGDEGPPMLQVDENIMTIGSDDTWAMEPEEEATRPSPPTVIRVIPAAVTLKSDPSSASDGNGRQRLSLALALAHPLPAGTSTLAGWQLPFKLVASCTEEALNAHMSLPPGLRGPVSDLQVSTLICM